MQGVLPFPQGWQCHSRLPCVAVNVSTFICKSSSVLHERKNTAQNAGIYTFVEPIKTNQEQTQKVPRVFQEKVT